VGWHLSGGDADAPAFASTIIIGTSFVMRVLFFATFFFTKIAMSGDRYLISEQNDPLVSPNPQMLPGRRGRAGVHTGVAYVLYLSEESLFAQFKYFAGKHSRNEKYQLWTHENHAEELLPFVPEKSLIKLNYLHQNPVRAGIVSQPEHYLYSSAVDYSGAKGIIGIDFIR